jgi:hypothetical protein
MGAHAQVGTTHSELAENVSDRYRLQGMMRARGFFAQFVRSHRTMPKALGKLLASLCRNRPVVPGPAR